MDNLALFSFQFVVAYERRKTPGRRTFQTNIKGSEMQIQVSEFHKIQDYVLTNVVQISIFKLYGQGQMKTGCKTNLIL